MKEDQARPEPQEDDTVDNENKTREYIFPGYKFPKCTNCGKRFQKRDKRAKTQDEKSCKKEQMNQE